MRTITWCGIDIAKATFQVALWQAGKALDGGNYPNTAEGFAAFQATLPHAGGLPPQVQVVVEPTGGYEERLVAFAYTQGWQVSVVNPKQVHDWGKGLGRRAKTDKVDAALLAQFGAARQPAAQPQLASEISELDSLLHRQQDLEQMLRQERNRLSGARQRPGLHPSVISSLERSIATLEAEHDAIAQAIKAHQTRHPDLKAQAKLLRTIPGVGRKNVLPLLVRLARFHTLTSGQGTAKALTACVGLDPQPFESGTSVYKRAGISRMGDTVLRQYLYMGALGGVRGTGPNPLGDFYHHLVGRHKPKRVALVAAAHKILIWAWAVYRTKTPFDPCRAAAKHRQSPQLPP